jgi:hypothetical protein
MLSPHLSRYLVPLSPLRNFTKLKFFTSSYPWVFLAGVQKRTLATTGEMFGSEHSFSILTDPPTIAAIFIA